MLGNIITNLGGYTGYNILANNLISGLRRYYGEKGENISDHINILPDANSSTKDVMVKKILENQNNRIAKATIALYPFQKMMDFYADVRIGFPMYEGNLMSIQTVETLNTLDYILSPCNHLTNLYQDLLDVPVVQINAGIDTQLFQLFNPSKIKRDSEKPYNEQNPCIFLMVGKFENRKASIETLIAFLKYFENHEMRNSVVLKLKWLTKGWSRGMHEIKSATSALFKMYPNASKRIMFLDNPYEDMLRLYNEADCFLFPSKAEGIGLPVLEAMACELPCITTGYTSLSTYTNEDVCIRLPDRGQVPMVDEFYNIRPEHWGTFGKIELDDLVDAIDKFMSMSQKERLDMGNRARKFVSEHFTNELFAERIVNFLKEI